MKAMILAAGKGSRLSSLRKKLPKVLFPVCGMPILEHNLRYLRKQGVRQVAINLHDHADQISDFLRKRRVQGLEIRLNYETELLGTAGALLPFADFFHKSDFFVLYGDNLVDFKLRPFAKEHRVSRSVMTLGVFRPEETLFSGIAAGAVYCRQDNRVSSFCEKRGRRQTTEGSWVNAGAMMCSPEILNEIPRGVASDFARDLYPNLLGKKKRLSIYQGASYVLASDTPESWKRTCRIANQWMRSL